MPSPPSVAEGICCPAATRSRHGGSFTCARASRGRRVAAGKPTFVKLVAAQPLSPSHLCTLSAPPLRVFRIFEDLRARRPTKAEAQIICTPDRRIAPRSSSSSRRVGPPFVIACRFRNGLLTASNHGGNDRCQKVSPLISPRGRKR